MRSFFGGSAALAAVLLMLPLAQAFAASAPGDAGGGDAATVVRVAVDLPVDHPVVAAGWKAFVETAESRAPGALDFQLFVNGAIVGSARSLEGLSRGEVDMGFVAPSEHPGEFPVATFLTELSMIGNDGVTASAALTELMLLHCPPCREEYDQKGLVFLGTYSSAPYVLLWADPISDAQFLKAKRVRTPGSLWDRLLRSVGAIPVGHKMSSGEALATGTADAVIDVALALQDETLWGATNAITKVPLGSYRGASPFTVNREYWIGLTNAQRSALLAAAPAGLVATTLMYAGQSDYMLNVSRERGLEVREPDESLRDAVTAFLKGDTMLSAEGTRLDGGHARAVSLANTYRALYGKYATLLEPLETWAEKVAVLEREIYDKLDPVTYAPKAEFDSMWEDSPGEPPGGRNATLPGQRPAEAPEQRSSEAAETTTDSSPNTELSVKPTE